MAYRYLFGPVYSRRFGVSLGIDLSPDQKSCNFDCLYCELGAAKPTDEIKNPPPPEDILTELKDFLASNKKPDVITITANGEPTLYPYLDRLIDEINEIKEDTKTLILTNSSTINDKKVQQTLKKFDYVKLSLDAISPDVFKKVDRPLNGVDISSILNGIEEFSKIYRGKLLIEVLVVRFVNDSLEEMEKIAQFLSGIKPYRIDLGTVDRPPAYRVFPVDDETLYELARVFEKYDLPVNVVERKYQYTPDFDLTEEDILNTLKKRPLTEEDVETLFSPHSKMILQKLEKEGKVKKKKLNGKNFFIGV